MPRNPHSLDTPAVPASGVDVPDLPRSGADAERGTAPVPRSPSRIQWSLGAVKPKKVIHAPACRFAKHRYSWADGMTAEEVVEALWEDGALEWHAAHKVCVPHLHWLMVMVGARS